MPTFTGMTPEEWRKWIAENTAEASCLRVPTGKTGGPDACGNWNPDREDTEPCRKSVEEPEEPKNNQGLEHCFKCGRKTVKIEGAMSWYDVCPVCKL